MTNKTECNCSLSIRLCGDGCKKCQPETYIFNLENELQTAEQEVEQLRSENESLKKENAEMKDEDKISAAVIEKCCNLLAQIAITIKGEPKELTRHSYHDLPELVLVLHVENELNKHRILEQSDEIIAQAKRITKLEELMNSEEKS